MKTLATEFMETLNELLPCVICSFNVPSNNDKTPFNILMRANKIIKIINCVRVDNLTNFFSMNYMEVLNFKIKNKKIICDVDRFIFALNKNIILKIENIGIQLQLHALDRPAL